MHAAKKETEELIIQGKIRHRGNPILRWMFTNVAVRENATGLSRPDKAKSADRIDGVVAMIMAIGRAVAAEDLAAPFIWTMGD
jgi:phage terminase large subunit-like protein